jgi:putative sporulation protein YtaF
MFKLFSLIVLAFAVSLDSFGAGLTYGLRKIRIPFRSIAIITLCSAAMIVISMTLGQGLMSFLPASVENRLGPIILIGVGGWALWQVMQERDHGEQGEGLVKEKTVLQLAVCF